MQETLPGGILPLALEDPKSVGGYPLLGRIGSGGMGTVYLAEGEDGARVAVKTIHPRLAEDAVFRARFADEAALAGRVASFCTAAIVAHGEDTALHAAGLPYIVSEYIGGVPLARRVNESGPLPASDLHGVASGVATALAAIREAGLVHRDLKPSNVVLTLSGPRVIDFGIARALDASTSWTTTGTVLGTPGWMAPEVLVGGSATPAADVFAWGLLMAYAGTGRPAFGEGQALDVARRVVQEEPDLRGLEDGPLKDLVRAALAKKPENRPTAPELMMRLVGREENAAAPPEEEEIPGRPGRPLLVLAIMAVVAGLALGVVAALSAGPVPEAEPRAEIVVPTPSSDELRVSRGTG
ncbi:serine/threonine-protein kinase [Actinocorallia sp. A-T 12471]|uniref:serine/threonine-protein kinase n=1 Tax=Actinocorallia sp. A-T 12471 TaxID=3089813 RepID=UPI0029CC1DF6|nr:serine/threonine-protein kinase [Actinocorallia sp. A-T 12471]MDX6742916.1 serine/threonine-protein kinase [Actinocorallia sp. A-T 12471]